MDGPSDLEFLQEHAETRDRLTLELRRIQTERQWAGLDNPLPTPPTPVPPSNIVPFPRPPKPAYERRGGNAQLLDYLYGLESQALQPLAADRSREFFHLATTGPTARALRARRRMIARVLDDTCRRHGQDTRILCISVGHCREVELAHEVRHGRFGEMLVFDDDPVRLATVRQSYGGLGVSACQGNLDQLLENHFGFSGYHLVYAAEACDLLDDRACERLAYRLFQAVGPGGRLLLANCRPGSASIDGLPALLEWRPHCRADAQLAALLDGVQGPEIASVRLFQDVGQRIGFLEARRSGDLAGH
ncbi:hypothetical protein D9M68_241510 [compost metagenome]